MRIFAKWMCITDQCQFIFVRGERGCLTRRSRLTRWCFNACNWMVTHLSMDTASAVAARFAAHHRRALSVAAGYVGLDATQPPAEPFCKLMPCAP